MNNPNSTEDQLLSVKYRIQQSGVKQQKLEDRLLIISDELKKSKRNSQIFMISFFVVVVFMGILMYYLSKNKPEVEQIAQTNTEELNPIQKANKVFKEELASFRADIVAYEERLQNDEHFLPPEKLIIKDKKKKKKPKGKFQHAILTDAYRKNGVVFIEADFVEYTEGKKAIEEAIKHGEAEYDINEKGDTLYFLYDGYYINNWNPLHRILELDEDVTIPDVVNQIEGGGFPVKALQKVIKNNSLFILEVKNGVVYKIKKQKLP